MASSSSTSAPPAAAPPAGAGAAALASGSSEPGGPLQLGERALNRLLLTSQVSYVEELLAERRVLLLGLHRAPPVLELAQSCGELVVVDPSATRIRSWKNRAQGVQASWLVANLADTGLAGASFDAILTFDPILPGEDATAVLAELRRLLHPDGFLLLSLPGPGRRVLEPLAPGPLPDLLAFRAQVKEHFPQVELLYQQTSLAVQVSTRIDALPTWQAPLAQPDMSVHSYVLLCSHLEIELETQALTRFSLKPVLESLRAPARRRAELLEAAQVQLEEALRARSMPSVSVPLPEPTGPTVDLPSEELSSPEDLLPSLLSRPVPRTTFTIDAGGPAPDFPIHPDEVTLHDGPNARPRDAAGRSAELMAELQRLQEENADLRLELQESDGALSASERIRRDQIDQLRSTTRLLEQQLEEHGRLQDLFAALQKDHAQLQQHFDEVEARLKEPDDLSDDAFDESSQPLISEKSFPPMEITNDPIIEALAPSARSALRKQRIYFERQLTREQLKIWELEEKVKVLESRPAAGAGVGEKGEGDPSGVVGESAGGGAQGGGKRPAWTRAAATGSSPPPEPARSQNKASFELGTIPGGLAAEIDHSVSIELPAQPVSRDAAARARRPIGSPLASSSTATGLPTAGGSKEFSAGVPGAAPLGGQDASGPFGSGPAAAADSLRTDDILRSVFDAEASAQELEPLVPGAPLGHARGVGEKMFGVEHASEGKSPAESRFSAHRSGADPTRAAIPGPTARAGERTPREASGADGTRSSSSPSYNPPPVAGDALNTLFPATPQERSRAAVATVPEPLRAETLREAPSSRETPFESGLDLLPEVQAPTPPRRRQVGDPLAASFHFLDADPAPGGAPDDSDLDRSGEESDGDEGDRGLPPLPPIPRPSEEMQRALLEDWDALPSKPQTQGLAWNAPVVKGTARPAPLLELPSPGLRSTAPTATRASGQAPAPSEDGTVSFLLEEDEERPVQSRREGRARAQARAEAAAAAAGASPARAAVGVGSVAAARGPRSSAAGRPADGAQALLEGLSQQSLRELPSIAKKTSPDRSGRERTRAEGTKADAAGVAEPGARGPARPTARPPVVMPESSTSLEESFFQNAESGRIGKRQSGSENAGKRRGPGSPVTLPSWSGPVPQGSGAPRPAAAPEASEEVPQPLMQRFLTRFWK